MALTRYPVPDTNATATAIATATADALTVSDIGNILQNILTELKIHTVILQQAFNNTEDMQLYRDNPNQQL